MTERTEVIILGLFTATEGFHFYSARLPSAMTITAFVDSPQKVQAIYKGLIEAGLMTLALGISISLLAGSWIPLGLSLGAGALATWMYWRDLKSCPASWNGGLF